MRFIARHPRYSFQAQAISMQVLSTPQGAIQVPAMPQILCEFQQGGLSPWEEELALERLHFLGQPDQEAVPKTNRLAVFDTETWQLTTGADDDLRLFVESRLLNDPMFGQDFISADAPARKPPWPDYDKVSGVATLFELLRLLGHDADPMELEQVRLYEHSAQHRPEFLAALQDRQAELEGAPRPDPSTPVEEMVYSS